MPKIRIFEQRQIPLLNPDLYLSAAELDDWLLLCTFGHLMWTLGPGRSGWLRNLIDRNKAYEYLVIRYAYACWMELGFRRGRAIECWMPDVIYLEVKITDVEEAVLATRLSIITRAGKKTWTRRSVPDWARPFDGRNCNAIEKEVR